jgi:hypothetical protein
MPFPPPLLTRPPHRVPPFPFVQPWPAGILSIDIDIVETNSTVLRTSSSSSSPHPSPLFPSLTGLPALRVALVTSVAAGADPRPTPEQVTVACGLIATLVPWLPVKPCSTARTPLDLNLAAGATLAAGVVTRANTLSPAAYEAGDTNEYRPFSTTTSPSSSSSSVSPGGPLAWGAGFVDLAANAVVTAASTDLPGCGIPVAQGAPGLFFPASVERRGGGRRGSSTSSSSFSATGPVATLVAERHAAWTAAGLSDDSWQPLSLHLSLRPAGVLAPSLTRVRVAVAETAVRLDVGLTVPPAGDLRGSGAIGRSELYLENEGVCEAHVLLAPASAAAEGAETVPVPSPAAASHPSSFLRALPPACDSYNAARVKGGVSAIEAWVRPPPSKKTPAAAALSPAWSSRVCRSVSGTGLHRELTYTVTATALVRESAVGAYARAAASTRDADSSSSSSVSSSPSDRSPCHVALLQTVPETAYLDLDEVRDQQRGAGLAGFSAADNVIAEGALLRAFSRFIDVERPASVSTQHVLLLAHAIHAEAAPAAASGAAAALPAPTNIYGGATVSVERVEPEPGSTDSSKGGGPLLRVTVRATVKQLLHVRYQSPGCAKPDAAGAAAASSSSSTGSAEGACVTWRELGGAPYGTRLNVDGSIYLQAPGAHLATNGSAAGVKPTTAGCYATAHVPLPTMHLQCRPHAAAAVGGRRAAEGAAAGDPLGALEAALEAAGAAPGAWLPVPLSNSGVPTHVLAAADNDDNDDEGACTGPLAPVPIGYAEHHLLVAIVTAATTLLGSAIAVYTGWRMKSAAGPPGPGGWRRAPKAKGPVPAAEAPASAHHGSSALEGVLNLGLDVPASATSAVRGNGGAGGEDADGAAAPATASKRSGKKGPRAASQTTPVRRR